MIKRLQVVTRKNVKKLGTKKKSILNVDELNAYKVAYEKELKAKDYIFYICGPGLLASLFSFLLLYYILFSLLMFFVGAIYGWKVFLPKSVKRNYEIHSFGQRNKFVNNMTQILTDENKTVPRALSIAYSRSEGEFRKDLLQLEARLMGADSQDIRDAFLKLAEKYSDDIIFVQYLEQLETAMLEGRANIDTLKDIKSYHNDMKKKQNEYEMKKQSYLKDMKMLVIVVVVFLLSVTFSFGFSTYLHNFAHHPIGWLTCSIYLLLMAHFFRRFSSYIFDDSIMEVDI